jgi:hypothetical protein
MMTRKRSIQEQFVGKVLKKKNVRRFFDEKIVKRFDCLGPMLLN